MQGNTLTSTLHHHYATRLALVCCVDIDQKQGPGRLSAVRPSLYEPPNRTYWSVSTALHWCRWSGRRHKNLGYDKIVVLQRVVNIMTRLQAGQKEESGFIPGRDKRVLFSPKWPDKFWSPPILLFSRYQSSSLGVKHPGYAVYHSPPTNVKVKNDWGYTSPSVCLHGGAKGSFTLHMTKGYNTVL